MKKTIFLTGGTGLLGSYLLKLLLKGEHKVYALTRPKEGISLKDRVVKAIRFWNPRVILKNLSVIKGDITQPYLGLEKDIYKDLSRQVDEVYHCAAVINLHWPLDIIREVNVEGTRNVLDFACTCRKAKVNHISTAYIYGSFTDRFSEEDLDLGQKFNTTYEQSKFEAEKAVYEYRKKGLWVDIYRPPIIIGHSETGKIFKFYNVYQLVNLCNLGLFSRLPILGIYVRMIPVDWVAEAICTISENTPDKNKTYHPFTRTPISADDFISCGCELMGIPKPRAVSLRNFDTWKLTYAQYQILKKNILSISFNNKLNSDYTCDILRQNGYSFKPIDKPLMEHVLKYFVQRQNLKPKRNI